MLNKFHISLTAILIIACVILVLLLNKSCNDVKKGKDFETMYNASQDSLHKKRNKDGTEETTTALLYGSVASLKKLHADDSSAIGRLQKLVDKLTISATVFSTATTNTISSATTVVPHDTVIKGDSILIYPEYRTKFKNKWEDFDVRANRDTILVNYKVFNDFSFEQKWERQKWYKAKVPVITVKNNNPKTETTELKSFTVKPKKHSRLKNIGAGIVIGAVGGFIINQQLRN